MFPRPFPRPLAFLAFSVVTLHVLSVVFLGTQPIGTLIGNSLQISSSFLAAYMCYRAARKQEGFSRSFWTLVGFSMVVWGVADMGWAYCELALHTVPSPGSLVRFLFDTHGMFFVMAVFLNQEKTDSPRRFGRNPRFSADRHSVFLHLLRNVLSAGDEPRP